MGVVRVSTELGLLFEPLKGVISEQREDVVQYALDPLYVKVERLDKIADDMMNQLVPDNELLESYPNRAKASYIGGLYTNIWMGFIIGLVFSFVILVSLVFTNQAALDGLRKAIGGA
ncbi:MAG: Tetrahydromethanopterin S-methyltransferase subunit B [Methanosaeta sp. PtaB.Bin039]|nr:MAG: Tetrahydromethanopterin S-methyltransferase subunit B [Methanosaeta sp. PtaB.Bin039]OPY45111.1 MAG: Tetrahydromethanopterin S-methyltransferase subunit B [Methanosaeta sp. PtaU1.Bin028]HOT07762.1 tetrahydromethanopterin S-methyltransferase subunit B [Methanotrichaceae archaeon]HQF16023.1 tetrahydromethanopterin S-methyltransferase subunit B [Methanotrichaceae archaeon]HQI90861.1 tetrahydromethanopterin S-methyltransferase subunit B [Methanotrichaceae archaeon]